MLIYQTENFGKRFEYRSNEHKNWIVPPHIHEFSEIAFTKEGVSTIILDGKKLTLPEWHLVFIFPNQIHEYSDETESHLRCAVFSNDHVPAFFDKIQDLRPQNPIIDMTDSKELLEELSETEWSDIVKISGLLNMICDKVLKRSEWIEKEKANDSMFYDVICYISQNFKEDIHISDLAKKLGYHEKYLSSSIHALTGMNFRTFLAYYRVNFAKSLLRSKDKLSLRISDVAYQCGFFSINSFNRVFREITGMTPKEYCERKSSARFL